jgi:hypothetical protein
MLNFKSVSIACRVVSVAFFFSAWATLCEAATISYGSFGPVAPGVHFNNVTESSGTDAVPLYGTPTPFSVGLDFDPLSFVAFGSAGGVDLTQGQLNFGIKSASDTIGISAINLFEAGDYALNGIGTSATQVFAGAIVRITVTEIDGDNVAPISLAPVDGSVGFNLLANSGLVEPWSLGLFLNIASQLSSLGISFKTGATEIEVSIDNQLLALSEASSIAFITESDFKFGVEPSVVPEPSPLAMVVSCGVMVAVVNWWRRRRWMASSSPEARSGTRYRIYPAIYLPALKGEAAGARKGTASAGITKGSSSGRAGGRLRHFGSRGPVLAKA